MSREVCVTVTLKEWYINDEDTRFVSSLTVLLPVLLAQSYWVSRPLLIEVYNH